MDKDNSTKDEKQKLYNLIEETKHKLKQRLDFEDRYLTYTKKETELLNEIHYHYPHPHKNSFIDALIYNQSVLKKQLESDKVELQEQLQRFENQLNECNE